MRQKISAVIAGILVLLVLAVCIAGIALIAQARDGWCMTFWTDGIERCPVEPDGQASAPRTDG
jgi:hypothetical protein